MRAHSRRLLLFWRRVESSRHSGRGGRRARRDQLRLQWRRSRTGMPGRLRCFVPREHGCLMPGRRRCLVPGEHGCLMPGALRCLGAFRRRGGAGSLYLLRSPWQGGGSQQKQSCARSNETHRRRDDLHASHPPTFHVAPGLNPARAALKGGAIGQRDRMLPSPAHREGVAGVSQLCLSILACRPLACASTGLLT